MNERIQELFKKAGGKTSIHNLTSNPIQHREYRELWDDRIEKFAELIVRECIQSIRPYDASGHFEEAIRKHFYGVEE